MRISHASIPADDPERVARFLAELTRGRALPFPPAGPRAYIVWSQDSEIELQVVPRGAVMEPGPQGAQCATDAHARRRSETHLALYLDRSAEAIMEMARREGWETGDYDRGGFFRSVEVWVENAFLVECFDPEAGERYQKFMTPENWQNALSAFA